MTNVKNKNHFHLWLLNDRGNGYFKRARVYKHRTAAYRALRHYPGGMVLKCLGPPIHECRYEEPCPCDEAKS